VVKVLPAAKTNWVLAVQRILADEGCGCDIYSPGELSAALRAGVEPQFISVNGVPKDTDHIHRSIQVGAQRTVDSLEELAVIEQAAADLGQTAKPTFVWVYPWWGALPVFVFVYIPFFAAAFYVHDWLPLRQIQFIGILGAIDVVLMILLAGILHWI
jgi:hypothetical protein